MDIFAHALWTAAAARVSKRRSSRRIRVGWAAFWGVFPDLFAFTIPITMGIWGRLANPETSLPAGPPGLPRMELARQLYQYSHSLVIFAAVFALVWIAARRPALELLGWSLHILIDIPTHTTRFFATPFLWPIASYRFNGISWGNRWFMLANYTALASVYVLLWWTGRRKRRSSPEEAAPIRGLCH